MLGDVERIGASDTDEVGMQDVRNGLEVHLFAPPNRILHGFESLSRHWNESDERVMRISCGSGQVKPQGYICPSTPTFELLDCVHEDRVTVGN